MSPQIVRFYVTKKEIRIAIREARIAFLVATYPVSENPKEDSDDEAASLMKTIPPKYRDLEEIFSTELAGKCLSLLTTTHVIDLEDDAMLLYGSIYPLAQKELEVLWAYLAITIEKG